ncbi:FAD-dependent oxidoreductase [Streptomyces diacarni]|uniref:FAD-dependent oxidoreductase n=1 Tax=Streptomyces diacarni TaxID=2800381 RepID=A0A367EVC1_9ACTN|nr:NAD(P)/FAD-dependent oxidoreductase [Streptomyces diacarni]RCG21337.1 FAD-dependent oxidoreductase [Streptomyces diacarni]
MSGGPELDAVVVGAGVAGLTAAHELRRAGLRVRVLEERAEVGGRMHSFRHGGWTVDEGAEQISEHGYRATWELLRRLGVPDEDVPLIGKSIGVWRSGRAHPGVAARNAPVTGAGLTPRARLDLLRLTAWLARHGSAFDGDRPERTPAGAATVAEFAHRYHPDLHDYLLQPVAGNFFGWRTEHSAAAPLLSLLGSVGTTERWRTYRDGMDLLTRRLAEDLDVVTGTPVREVVSEPGFARVRLADGAGGAGGEMTARAVVLAVPAPVAARLHANAPADELPFLTACTFTPVLKVSCLLDRPLAPPSPRPLYVLLTPAAEESVLSGIIVDHAKHPYRAPAGKGLLTLMAAPGQLPALLRAPDKEVADQLVAAAERYVPGLHRACTETFVHGFAHGLPEATPQALHHRGAFARRPVRPVEYAGDWLTLRPASEGAVRAGALAASRVLATVRPGAGPSHRRSVSGALVGGGKETE